jgi:outer membrane protein TolC
MTAITAQADQFLALIDLYKALGGGWVLQSDGTVQKESTNRNLDP